MIKWRSNNRFSIDVVTFQLPDLGLGKRSDFRPGEFVLQKSAWMVERYVKLIKTLEPKTIFELGIRWGGSSVFFQLLAQADKLVTVDILADRVTALDEYIEDNQLRDKLKPYYDVNQADTAKLREIVAEEFAGRPLDLVIDDASHFFDETSHSFNALFPYVGPGGVYVIEDWPWAHAKVGNPDDLPGFYPYRKPLTKLIIEIVLACPSTDGMIEKIEIDRNSITIWRGDKPIEAEGFDIKKCCLARGRALIA